jgi:hypothetical protein
MEVTVSSGMNLPPLMGAWTRRAGAPVDVGRWKKFNPFKNKWSLDWEFYAELPL